MVVISKIFQIKTKHFFIKLVRCAEHLGIVNCLAAWFSFFASFYQVSVVPNVLMLVCHSSPFFDRAILYFWFHKTTFMILESVRSYAFGNNASQAKCLNFCQIILIFIFTVILQT